MKALRERFRSLPQELLQGNQPWAVRVHRALSWLERAGEQKDIETRFIFAWIGFNALYGQSREGLPTSRSQGDYGGGDRHEYIGFLNRLSQLDGETLMQPAGRMQHFVGELIGCKYLYFGYWRNLPDWDASLDRDLLSLDRAMQRRDAGQIYSLVFDRLYIMRLQLLHGGATFGSRVNRKTLKLCELVLRQLMPAVVEVMIDRGCGEEWGEASYPPRDQQTIQEKRP